MANQPNNVEFQVDFPFRGSRTYIHSTSICNHFAPRFPNAERFELVLKDVMGSRVIFTPVDTVQTGTGYVKLHADGDDLVWKLSEDKTNPAMTRDIYDEDAIIAGCVIDEGSLTCSATGIESFFDRLIAANKGLINQSLNPGVKLLAAKVVVDGFPNNDATFSLKLASHAGTRIFKTHLILNDRKAGEVIFYGQ